MIGGLSFGAPWLGGIALLAIPATIAIHFLQFPSRPVTASTLFLLERLAPESKGGRRLQQLRNSLPLWLQLLAALILAWLLSSPRWLKSDSRQTLVVVLDSSVSMRAFHQQLKLDERLKPLEAAAAKTEWILLESDPSAPRLYRGDKLAEPSAIASAWTPRLGHHDPAPVLRLAQALVPDSGDVIYVTDHPVTLAPGITALGIGQPVENVGFSGVRVTPEGWEALVKNYGQRSQEVAWWIRGATSGDGARASMTLKSGEAQSIRGSFPPDGRLHVMLENKEDAFEMDNALPIIRPQAKPLRIDLPSKVSVLGHWLADFAKTLSEVSTSGEGGDVAGLRFQLQDAKLLLTEKGYGVSILQNPAASTTQLGGMIAAENHPLMEGLSWQGLLVTEGERIALHDDDKPLLWIGRLPLIFLRGEQLVINFDPVYSNATRVPAFVLLLHRYTEGYRATLPVAESLNVETNQRLMILGKPGRLLQSPASSLPQRAPADPQFFTLLEEVPTGSPRLRLDGAAHFADAREADFQKAGSSDPIASIVRKRSEQNSEQDTSSPLWLLALAGLMLWNWGWQERRRDV